MTYRTIGSKILIELIPEKKGRKEIISTETNDKIKGKVLSVGANCGNIQNGIFSRDIFQDDIVWVYESDATQLPFNKNYFILEYEDVLVVETF